MMMILNLILTAILLLFGYYYLRRRSLRQKQSSRVDFLGRHHKWRDFDEERTYFCYLCEKLLIFNSISLSFVSKAKKCIKCGIIVHRYCLQVKGMKEQRCKLGCEPKALKNQSQHQWVSGNDEDDACCSSCGRYCNNVFDYNTLRCLWCKKIRHRSCNADNLHCDYGEYSSISILPSEVENVELEEDLTIKHVTFNIDPSKDIVIFVINRLSGPQFGEEIIEHLYKYFNPAQVIDLLDGEIQDIKLFKGIPGLKVVVGGGDGTVSSISSVVRDLLGEKVPVIPMPLGTGNDLSRAIGWGGALNTVEELHHYIQKLQGRPKATYIDRWSITAISGIDLTPFRGKDRGKAYIQRLLNKKRNGGSTQDKQSSQEDKDKSADRPEDEQREILLDEQMFLYCGFGIGGQFSYKFNKIREQYPNLFKSRIGNKFMYSQMGALKTINFLATNTKINKEFEIYGDDLERLEVPKCENFTFQNTQSWGGGCKDNWNNKNLAKDIEALNNRNPSRKDSTMTEGKQSFHLQSYSDKKLESVCMASIFELTKIQVGLIKPRRVAQEKTYTIVHQADKEVFLQVDGEGFRLFGPFVLCIRHQDQVLMHRNEMAEEKAQLHSEVIRVLHWGEQEGHISEQQRQILLNKFMSFD